MTVSPVLSEHSEYRSSQGSDDGKFVVRVKRPGFLSTPMTIELQEREGNTAVRVTTKSQRFIVGDVFGYYARDIREFLARLREEVFLGGKRQTERRRDDAGTKG
jgi:hypothetical protein